VLGRGLTTSSLKKGLRNVTYDLGLGQFDWNDLSNGNWTRNLELGELGVSVLRFFENRVKRINKMPVRFIESTGTREVLNHQAIIHVLWECKC
jgi:hypothetical protein